MRRRPPIGDDEVRRDPLFPFPMEQRKTVLIRGVIL